MTNVNLNSFTDILGDEIANSQESQPLSISSGNSVEVLEPNKSETSFLHKNSLKTGIRPAKGTGQYGQFRSVEEIEEKYRDIFSYPFFNLVQSSVIEDALYSDKSIVVCAPTGSGKTVIFEMAIVQLLMELEDKQYTDDFKIIYMAPVKALCTERLTEWYPKFTKLGHMCIEVTGDTDVDFSQLKPYRIIITTPEKWDMVTRRWREHRHLVEVIKLFLIDEVHILNDDTRGPVLEAVVSRMKTIEASAQSAHRIEQLQKQYQTFEDSDTPKPGSSKQDANPPKIRFVAVSATVGNPGDVAAWLGNTEKPAVYYKFGDESRPVKLKRVVEGYPCPEGTSIFKFDIILNYKLWPIIQKYHNGKPTLIFCNTRKSVGLTAEALSREITVSFSPEQKAKLTALASMIKNKKLQMLVLSGVGCHHAGLLYEERNYIESAFRNRDLPILITTTTLAMGVNLPAHLVIIKNTQQYVNGAYQEYSISTVLQMVGRAGRPQFDTEATAVIMTRLQDKPRYQALVGGSEPLQSYLHKRLPENLNSEAAMGTVNDVAQCVQWLRSTFLCVRAARDPKRYLGLPQAAPQQLISKKIEELCVKAMNGLASAGLITMDEASCIESTEAGRLMSIFYMDLETMKHIMKVNGTETLERLLWVICESHELADMHLRMDERRTLNLLNRNNAAATIRFPMKGKISTRQMKLNCIIQAILGCLNIPDPSLNQEAMKVMRIADRVCKCLVAYMTRPALVSTQPPYYNAVLNALILAKCVNAHLWENSPYVSKQLRGIGPTFSTLLATAGKVNFMLLEESHPRDLERIMNKGPPAGNVIRKQISLLPKYQLTMTPIDEKSVAVQLVLLNQNHLSENIEHLTAGDKHKSYIVVGDSENNLLLFTTFNDKELIGVYDGMITHHITRKPNFEHKMFAHCISSSFVGIDAQSEYTFKDLEAVYPLPPPMSMSEDFVKRKANTKQTTITDTFKERKRKSTTENDVSQSKEKKKRDNVLLEKFKCLKQSFGKTSIELKEDLDKTVMMSNKILQDFGQLEKPTVSTEYLPEGRCENMEIEPQSFNNNDATIQVIDTNTKLMEDDDLKFKINKILNEIDNEIAKGNYHSDLPAVDLSNKKAAQEKRDTLNKSNVSSVFFGEQTNMQNENSFNTAVKSSANSHNDVQKYSKENTLKDTSLHYITFKTPYRANQKHLQKNTKPKTKYNFVDLLNKNTNLNDEDDEPVDNSTNRFSEAIKTQIQKYLQQTKTISDLPDKSITELMETTSTSKENIEHEYTVTNPTPVMEQTNVTESNDTLRNDNVSEHDEIALEEKIDEIDKYMELDIESSNKCPCTQNVKEEEKIENKYQQMDPNIIETIDNAQIITEKPEQQKMECVDTTTEINEASVNRITDLLFNKNVVARKIKDQDKLEVRKVTCQENADIPAKHIPGTRYAITEITKLTDTMHYLESTNFHAQSTSTQSSTFLPNTDQRNETYRIENNKHTLVPYNIKAMSNTHNEDIASKKRVVFCENLIDDNTKSTVTRFSSPASSMMRQATPNGSPIMSKNNQIQLQPYQSNLMRTEKAVTSEMQNKLNLINANLSSAHVQNNSEPNRTQLSLLNSLNGNERSENGHDFNSDPSQNTSVRNYAYSTAKIDVATREDVTVIRKIQMDLNITEIIAQRRGMNRKPETPTDYKNMLCTDKGNQEIRLYGSALSRPNTKNNISNIPKPTIERTSQTPHNKLAIIPQGKPDKKTQETKGIEHKKNLMLTECGDRRNANYIPSALNKSPTLRSLEINQTKEHSGITKKNNHLAHESNVERKSPQKEANKIENILQKYSKVLRKDKAVSHNQKISQSHNITKDDTIAVFSQPEKTKRLFKINDIHSMTIPLPTSIILPPNQEEYENNEDKNYELTENRFEFGTTNNTPQMIPIKENVPLPHVPKPEYEREESIENIHAQNLVQIQNVANRIEDDLSKFNLNETLIDELDPEELETHVDIDQSMFNPKTLLQCYNNDDSDTYVPPPPGFGDETESQEQVDKDAVPMECYEPVSWEDTQNDVSLENSIFQDDSQLELTPRKEIETWTLSHHDEIYQNLSTSTGYNSSRQSFTIMHTPTPRLHNRPFQNVSVTRQSKLGQFKYYPKKKLQKP